MRTIQQMATQSLRPHPRNARTHSKKQIRQISESISNFGFTVPILIDEKGVIIAGHGRFEAAKLLGLPEVPVIIQEGLSEAKKRALLIADNKIAQNAGWDRERLAHEIPELAELLIEEDLNIAITGFEPIEIDQLAIDFEQDASDPSDAIAAEWVSPTAVSSRGDLWHLGAHRLLCGDARCAADLERLMSGEKAAMAFLDPPYNVRISSVVGRGRIKHDEFAMASGEMTPDDFVGFLTATLRHAASHSSETALHFVCMDWRHVSALILAGEDVYRRMLNLVVWVKNNPGQGSFYRSQHELIGVFCVGDGSYLNNVELGRHGRSRSNVWRYPGISSARQGRLEELAAHPTVKPVAMVVDALKDCTKRGDVVLDSFCGIRHHPPRRREGRETSLCPGARAPLRGRRRKALAGLHRQRRRPF